MVLIPKDIKLKDYLIENETFNRVVKDKKADRIEIEVGDSKQPDFKPQFKIKRWDNEVNFSMRAEEHVDATVEIDGEKIKYITPDYEVHQYDKPEVAEDGGFEFEWMLPKKPKSNILKATIQTKGLNFYYQPDLTDKEKKEGAKRPENIIGSYAVYHKAKANNTVGGKHYKVGKAFHIYRPEAIDANGLKVWCELNIDKDLTVTVPQEFLDNATYPVIVDPTFGYDVLGSSYQYLSPNYLTGFRPHTCTENGIITDISIGIHTPNLSTNIYFIVYNDSDDSLIGYTEELTSISSNWNSASVISGGSVVASTNYILAYTSNEAQYIKYDTVSGFYRAYILRTYNTIPTDPAGWTSKTASAGNKYSIYATYTASASGGSKINIGDDFKEIASVSINIGDSWKPVTSIKLNVGDSWKDVNI